jgi:hypothetical protein
VLDVENTVQVSQECLKVTANTIPNHVNGSVLDAESDPRAQAWEGQTHNAMTSEQITFLVNAVSMRLSPDWLICSFHSGISLHMDITAT